MLSCSPVTALRGYGCSARREGTGCFRCLVPRRPWARSHCLLRVLCRVPAGGRASILFFFFLADSNRMLSVASSPTQVTKKGLSAQSRVVTCLFLAHSVVAPSEIPAPSLPTPLRLLVLHRFLRQPFTNSLSVCISRCEWPPTWAPSQVVYPAPSHWWLLPAPAAPALEGDSHTPCREPPG